MKKSTFSVANTKGCFRTTNASFLDLCQKKKKLAESTDTISPVRRELLTHGYVVLPAVVPRQGVTDIWQHTGADPPTEIPTISSVVIANFHSLMKGKKKKGGGGGRGNNEK